MTVEAEAGMDAHIIESCVEDFMRKTPEIVVQNIESLERSYSMLGQLIMSVKPMKEAAE